MTTPKLCTLPLSSVLLSSYSINALDLKACGCNFGKYSSESNILSRDEDNAAPLVVISSLIAALSHSQHSLFCPSQPREDRIIFTLTMAFLQFQQSNLACVQNCPHHISFTGCHVNLVRTAISFWVSDRWNQSAASLRSPSPQLLSLSCPRRGFCCCISAFLSPRAGSKRANL